MFLRSIASLLLGAGIAVVGVRHGDEARALIEATLARLVSADLQRLSDLQVALWVLYLVAALVLPLYHVRPILRYLRGRSGIGDACIRTECIQRLWRVPALLFSVFVLPSLPLFLSIFLDMLGRIGRIVSMRISQRRWMAREPRNLGVRSEI